MTSRRRAKARRAQASFGPAWGSGQLLVGMRTLTKRTRAMTFRLHKMTTLVEALKLAARRLRLIREWEYSEAESRRAARLADWGLLP